MLQNSLSSVTNEEFQLSEQHQAIYDVLLDTKNYRNDILALLINLCKLEYIFNQVVLNNLFDVVSSCRLTTLQIANSILDKLNVGNAVIKANSRLNVTGFSESVGLTVHLNSQMFDYQEALGVDLTVFNSKTTVKDNTARLKDKALIKRYRNTIPNSFNLKAQTFDIINYQDFFSTFIGIINDSSLLDEEAKTYLKSVLNDLFPVDFSKKVFESGFIEVSCKNVCFTYLLRKFQQLITYRGRYNDRWDNIKETIDLNLYTPVSFGLTINLPFQVVRYITQSNEVNLISVYSWIDSWIKSINVEVAEKNQETILKLGQVKPVNPYCLIPSHILHLDKKRREMGYYQDKERTESNKLSSIKNGFLVSIPNISNEDIIEWESVNNRLFDFIYKNNITSNATLYKQADLLDYCKDNNISFVGLFNDLHYLTYTTGDLLYNWDLNLHIFTSRANPYKIEVESLNSYQKPELLALNAFLNRNSLDVFTDHSLYEREKFSSVLFGGINLLCYVYDKLQNLVNLPDMQSFINQSLLFWTGFETAPKSLDDLNVENSDYYSELADNENQCLKVLLYIKKPLPKISFPTQIIILLGI